MASGRRGLRTVLWVLAAVLLSAGCEVNARSEATDSGDTNGDGDTEATATSASVVTDPSTMPVVTGPQGDVLEDGRHFVLIRSITPAAAGASMDLDLAQWFSADAADAAAAEDGVIAAGEQVENDFYIRNVSDRVRVMPVAGDAATQVVDWANCCELVPSTVDALAARGFAENHDAFWVDVSAGSVVRLDEQYRP